MFFFGHAKEDTPLPLECPQVNDKIELTERKNLRNHFGKYSFYQRQLSSLTTGYPSSRRRNAREATGGLSDGSPVNAIAIRSICLAHQDPDRATAAHRGRSA